MSQTTRLPLVVVTNREPYVDELSRHGIRTVKKAGGVVSALDPILRQRGGHWVAWGSGNADFITAPDGVRPVPPKAPRYQLHRVALSPEEVHGYYASYSNEGLWPLSHLLLERARFSRRAFSHYQAVNARFAETVAKVAAPRALVFSHDYHLALFPRLLRSRRPDVAIAHFWHIPWPPAMVFNFCPQHRQLLQGLLGADVLGFQTEEAVDNFLAAVERAFPLAVNRSRRVVRWEGRTVVVAAFPISVDVQGIRELALSPRVERLSRRLRRRLVGDEGSLMLAVDRADYTKGLLQRLAGLEEFLRRYPEHHGRFSLLQVLVPTRTEVPAYRRLFREVQEATEHLNRTWGRPGWRPLYTVRRSFDLERLTACYRAADVAIVNSIFDGMNLVAKEFVAAQVDRRGVLLLSQGAGAYEELTHALKLNPLDPEGFAATLDRALRMPPAERFRAMAAMQHYLAGHDIFDWAQHILGTLEGVAEQRTWSLSWSEKPAYDS